MSDLISRQALIERLFGNASEKELEGMFCEADTVLRLIKSQRPADQTELKRGKWIRYEDTHENSVKYICPFCGDYTAFRGEIAESTVNGNYIYCRHCGAKTGEDQ